MEEQRNKRMGSGRVFWVTGFGLLSLALLVVLAGRSFSATASSTTTTFGSSESTVSGVRRRDDRQLLEIFPVGRDPSVPLGLCEGDCDDDGGCIPGLICFQRRDAEPVPGCTFPADGNRFRSMDICILDPQITGNNTPPPTIIPITQSPTFVGLPPMAAPTVQENTNFNDLESIHDIPTPTDPPSIIATTTNSNQKEEDFNFDSDTTPNPTPKPQLNIINAPQPTRSPTEDPTLTPTYPPEPTPWPTATSTVVDTPQPTNLPQPSPWPTVVDTPQPTRLRPTPQPQVTFSPTPNGTNSWAQTYGMTEPFQFVGPPPLLPPIEPGLEWLWTPEYTQPRPLEQVGNNFNPPEAFPLGPCQADCDSSSDCAGPLRCYRRDAGGAPVPGCLGNDPSGDDYCVWPLNYQNGMPIPYDWVNEGFALKVYWEEGYNWQNETIERYWCMTRDYEGSPITGRCWMGTEEMDCDPKELYVGGCSRENPRQRFRFLPVSSDEVLVEAFHEGRCLQRTNLRITLETCDETLHTQRWFSIRGGFNERRFELSQKTQSQRCVNQDHHPKPGEVFRMHACEKTRRKTHLTSWFELYELPAV
ncbi:chromosome segregation ATPase-like protein [Seminavis robusta]|uniref:Chromosome segregation ATPase-like protein n=1 Tax=Seminavis robusta TaxID=568900 RepID=A0A9N8DCP2_9STRA|nr:chromosome segregation ATPase-like protein [Seminavis robusta]|eukprot:Sro86_g045580.1 chromosome segregation ATPase-like protein (586) ;mRNA; f:13673-15691